MMKWRFFRPLKSLLLVLCFAQGTLLAQAIRSNPGCRSTILPRNDDASSGLVNLGFSINLFGKQRSATYVNNNGNLTFDAPLEDYSPDPIGRVPYEMIAAFWADVDTRATLSNPVTYGTTTINDRRAFCANYVNVGFYELQNRLNSFQVVLIERSDSAPGDFDIEFNYERILWETGDASRGVDGFGGFSARVGYTNGTGLINTFFELPGSGQSGAFLDNSPNGLVRRSFNTDVPGRLLFNVRNGTLRSSLTNDPFALVFRSALNSGQNPAPQQVRLSSNGGQIQYNLVRVSTSDGGRWLSATPLGTGFTPGSITVSVDPSGLSRGAYSGELFIQPVDSSLASVTVPVTLLVGDLVPFTIRSGITNGASLISGVLVPGSIFSIFGENLAPAIEASTIIPLPFVRSGVSVLIGDVRVPLFLVSPTQINGQVPVNVPLGGATLQIQANGTSSPPVGINIAPTLPGLFVYSNSSQGVIQNQDFQLNTRTNPARAGSVFIAYLTGIGEVDNVVPAGTPAPDTPLSRALAQVTATVGGRQANVIFAGYTPRSIGLAQVNVQVPSGLSGEQQLVLFFNDVSSAPVSVFVAP